MIVTMKKRNWMIAFLLCFCLALSGNVFAAADDWPQTEAELEQQIEENAANMGISVEEYKELLQNTMFRYYSSYMKSIIQDYKFEDVTLADLYEQALRALIGYDRDKLELAFSSAFQALDPNSQYFPAESFSSFTQRLDENLTGVGITVSSIDGAIRVVGFPIENSPAKVAGICVGDELIAVDGNSVEGKTATEISPLIRGEEGTQVELTLTRDGEPYTVTLTRTKIKQNNVTYSFLEGNVLYLRLSSFNDGCAVEVKKALEEADQKGIKKVIFDLRNNTGGYGSEAFEIAAMFLPKGTLITTLEYKDETKNEAHYSTASFARQKYDTALLVNEYSASASELLAAAFQDNKMGVLIGTNTYGKGTGQKIYSLNAFNSGYKLTVCQYRTPDGSLLPATGLEPNILVENQEISINKSKDYPQITMERKLYEGDRGEDVRACQIRLAMLGYHPGNQTGVFDSKTAEAVCSFQADQGLYPCGDLDKATQSNLYVRSATLQVTQDDQLAAAVSYFSE